MNILTPIITWHAGRGFFWARIGRFGPGISVQNREIHPALFSERNGYMKTLRIGKWCVRALPRYIQP